VPSLRTAILGTLVICRIIPPALRICPIRPLASTGASGCGEAS